MRKKLLFYTLCLASSVLSALMVIVDTYGAAISRDIWVYANVSMIMGTILTLVTVLVFLVPVGEGKIGRYIDPNFEGLIVPKGKMLGLFIVMALGNTISTFGYFYIVDTMRDPSAVLPFIQLVILYLLLGEIIVEKDYPSIIEVESLIIIIIGAILASISPTGEFDLISFFLVITIINGGSTITILAQKRIRSLTVRGHRFDSINIRLWNLLLTTVFFVPLTGLVSPSALDLKLVTNELVMVAIVSMEITFFARVTYIRALGIGKASVTQAVTSISIILGIPLTWVGTYLMPNVFVGLPTTFWIALVKVFGTILVTLGIVALALSEVKAYILIRSTGGGRGSEILRSLSRIKGVVSVSALAGRYDFIVKIKVRALGKAYRVVVRELERIEGIRDFIWLSTLYEWEEI